MSDTEWVYDIEKVESCLFQLKVKARDAQEVADEIGIDLLHAGCLLYLAASNNQPTKLVYESIKTIQELELDNPLSIAEAIVADTERVYKEDTKNDIDLNCKVEVKKSTMDGEEKVNEDGEGVHDENVSINEMGPEFIEGLSSRKREQASTGDIVLDRPFGGETVRPLSRSEKIRQKVGEYMPSFEFPGSRGSSRGSNKSNSRESSRGGVSSGGMLSSGEEDTPGTPDNPGTPDSGGGKMPAVLSPRLFVNT